MVKPDNIIKGKIASPDGDTSKDIFYGVAYNGASAPVMQKVIQELTIQLQTLIQNGETI